MLTLGYEFVGSNRDLYVGLNMAGREDNDLGQIGRFVPLIRNLRRTHPDVPLSIHAGETTAPGTQIRETLVAGADRIGHGLNLLSDPELVLILRNGKVLIETSLVSNQLLGYVPDLDLHPFPEFLRGGIPTSLNTDDPGVWDSNMTDEFFVAVKRYNLSWGEVVRLGRNSLQYSFAEPALKTRLLEQYEAAVRGFEQRYSGRDWRERLGAVAATPSGYAQRNLGVR
jgi:adenosine deaminase CECR1